MGIDVEEGCLERILIGGLVEKSVAVKFKENLNGISTTDAIEWFINQIATGKMHIVEVK